MPFPPLLSAEARVNGKRVIATPVMTLWAEVIVIPLPFWNAPPAPSIRTNGTFPPSMVTLPLSSGGNGLCTVMVHGLVPLLNRMVSPDPAAMSAARKVGQDVPVQVA